jgi:hypothetical protein
MWYIIIIIVVIFIISQQYVNKDRHLTQSYGHAHFSEITNLSYIFYPGLLFAKPIRITLNTGDTLLIPKNWWHWIRTEPETHAINFLCNRKDSIPSKPVIIENLISDHDIELIKETIHEYAANNTPYNNWDNSSFAGLNYVIPSSFTRTNYLLTLDGYSFEKNMVIKEGIKNISTLSQVKAKYARPGSEFHYNFWLSFSKKNILAHHETGLHYDSLDSFLYVINGKKHVTLYPPEDSYLLAPYDITPNYALQKPIFMYYNEYAKQRDLSGKPSGHLLYKTLDFCATSTTILTAVQKIYDKSLKKNLIWGFKKAGDVYRWELYNYHYSSTDKFLVDKSHVPTLFIKPISNNILDILMDSDTIINSIDIENTVDVFNDEIHIYQAKNSKNAPYYGKGFDIKNNKIKQVGVFVYHAAHEVKKNHAKYFKELGLPHDMGMLRILLKYPCDHLCIWNKNGDIFIQWIGIDIHYFISFLEEFNYKKDLVTYIKDHIEDYRSLSHEITIVYDPVSRLPKRSGFYGCI